MKQYNFTPVDSTINTHRIPEEFKRFISSSLQELRRGHPVTVFTQEQLDILKSHVDEDILTVVYNPVDTYWVLYLKKGGK